MGFSEESIVYTDRTGKKKNRARKSLDILRALQTCVTLVTLGSVGRQEWMFSHVLSLKLGRKAWQMALELIAVINPSSYSATLTPGSINTCE